MAVRAAILACQAAAKPSAESHTLSASCVAVQASTACCCGWVPEFRGRRGVPCDSDEVQAPSLRPAVSAAPVVRKPAAAATRPPPAGVAAGVGGSRPPSRPGPSKWLQRHSGPPERVPPCPAVLASIMSRRPPTGAAIPRPLNVGRGGEMGRGPGPPLQRRYFGPRPSESVAGPEPASRRPGRRRRRLAHGTCAAKAEWASSCAGVQP
jgi:hypothetical protein